MGTKSDPGTYDCWAKALPDEPVFVFLGRDVHAPDAIRLWADLREQEEGPSDKVDEARALADGMERWAAQRRHDEMPGLSEVGLPETKGGPRDVGWPE